MKRLYFKTGNNIPYGQDFGRGFGLPPYVIFEVKKSDILTKTGDVWLTAPGNGMPGNYGNGSVVVKESDLQGNEYVKWVE